MNDQPTNDWTPQRPPLSTDTRNAVIIGLYQRGMTEQRIALMMKNHCTADTVARVIGQYQRRQARLLWNEE